MDILSPALRVRAWLARATSSPGFPEEQGVQIIGALHMVDGLAYHYENFTQHVAAAAGYFERVDATTALLAGDNRPEGVPVPVPTDAERPHLAALDHEAVAYLNRTGQFFYFARSIGRTDAIPKIVYLSTFRHKHTAHRSIDVPRDENEAQLQMQAMSFGFYRLRLCGVPRYQIVDDEGHKWFCMAEDHDLVMREVTELLLSLHCVQ